MFIKHNVITILWAVVILVLTLIPGNNIPVARAGTDKIVHFFIFAVLMYFMLRGFKKQSQFPYLAEHFIRTSFIICILYGCMIEIIQIFIPLRSFDLFDIAANSIGVGIGYFVYERFLYVNRK